MRKILIVFWLLVPVAFAAYHFGPGQEKMVLDEADALIKEADACAADELWGPAVEAYERAIAQLPASRVDAIRRLKLEKAKAQMLASELPRAYADLKSLLDEVGGGDGSDTEFEAEVRSSLAGAQYYMTWLMRLEGVPKDEWEADIEASRQNYRILAERAVNQGNDSAAKRHREDLEASIRLARMDLGELQGLPLPSQ